METYKLKYVADLFSVNPQTIRRWSAEFKDYLSVHAVPTGKRARQFTDDDLLALALVSSMKANRNTFDDIHASLANGERGSLPEDMPTNALIPIERNKQLAVQIENLQIELQTSQQEIQTYKALLDSSDKRLAESEARNRELLRELGRLEGKLETLEDKD